MEDINLKSILYLVLVLFELQAFIRCQNSFQKVMVFKFNCNVIVLTVIDVMLGSAADGYEFVSAVHPWGKVGGALPSQSFTSSSSSSRNFSASNGRLASSFAWMPLQKDKPDLKVKDYLQVDLGQERTVTAVATEGYMNNYVKEFKILLSEDGVLYNTYQSVHGDKHCKPAKQSLYVETSSYPPSSPDIVKVESPRPFTAYLEWKMPSVDPSCHANVTSYLMYYAPITRGQQHSYSLQIDQRNSNTFVSGLNPWIKYRFGLYAQNRIGRSSQSTPVEVFINGKAPDQPVNITYLQSETDSSFTIKWKNPPAESVNGDIKGYSVFHRQKSAKSWNGSHLVTLTTHATISSLSTGSTYEAFVVLFNNKYNISSEVKEVYIASREPVYSVDLTTGIKLSSDVGQLTIQWMIPATFKAIKTFSSDTLVAVTRRLGDSSWMERNVTNPYTTEYITFDGLHQWRIYEAKITLVTKRGIYFTNISTVLIKGPDRKDVVKIVSLKSTKKGSVDVTMKMPKQYISNNILRQTRIRWLLDGTSKLEKKIVIATSRTSVHSIDGLLSWSPYAFEVGIAVVASRSKMEVFTSRLVYVTVIGDSPGMAPGSVAAAARGPNAILVSWQLIPRRYINGYLHGYTVFLSSEHDKLPIHRTVSNTTTKILVTNLLPDTVYWIQVAGKNATGYGPLSDSFSIKTAKDPVPQAPVLIDARAISATEILINWTSVAELTQKKQNFTILLKKQGKQFYITNYSVVIEGRKERNMHHGFVLKDLKPQAIYTICLFETRSKGEKHTSSALSNCMNATTKPVPRPPTPQLMSAIALSPYDIRVTWMVLTVDIIEPAENYTVTATDKDGRKINRFVVNMRSKAHTTTPRTYTLMLKGLQPYTLYNISVYASKLYDNILINSELSRPLEVETKEAAPSEPRNLKINPTNGGYLLTWQAPAQLNGFLKKYRFKLWRSGSTEHLLDQFILSSRTEYEIISALKPYTRYWVSLEARTILFGPAAQLSFVTPEGLPSAPRDVKAVLNGTKFIITWRSPEEENGRIIGYKVHAQWSRLVGNNSIQYQYPLRPDEREITIYNIFLYGVKYTFTVYAETNQGPGPDSNAVTITVAARPKKIPKVSAPPQPTIVENKIGSTTMVVKLKPLTRQTVVLSLYQVIVERLISNSVERRAVHKIPTDVSDYKNATKQGDRFYVAAQFKAEDLPDAFVVGDGKTYNGFYNAPLQPSTVYKVHVRAGRKDKSGNFVFGESSWVKSPATAPRKKKARGSVVPLPIIAGIAGALLLIIILVTIIIMYLKKSNSSRRQNSKQRKEPYDVELEHLRPKAEPVSYTQDPKLRKTFFAGYQRPASLTGDFPLHPDHPPIGVTNYIKHVAKLHRGDNNGFRAEYNQLEMGKEFSWEVAHLPENKPKNRFANIVAYDHSRVILTKIPGIVGSDYINASYIDGFLKPNSYVATQGPLPGTFNDFWRMIWELRSSVIVMLTNLQEKNKLKCHKYWPDDCIEYGDVIVTMSRKEMYADYVIRTFLLERVDSPETREVKQFHFTVWPDHGVPKYATAILAFRRRVRTYAPPECGPTIVHCSAGVGRTGTYVTLDAMLNRITLQGDVDIFNFIAAIRTRRIAMEQYIFIYDAILEATQCGNTEITAGELRIMVNRLEKVSLDTKMTGFEKEWKTLNNVSPIPSKSACNIAVMPDNMAKNRNRNICVLPADNNLVRLLTIEDDEATAYINAAYVDGYKQRNAFILTQSPLNNTVMDFWRMLCEHKSASVVLLSALDEAEDFVKFWPEAHIREYEMITVECISKSRGNELGHGDTYRSTPRRGENELITRQFKVEDSRYPDFPLMIKLFQLTGWTETKVPSNCSMVIQLINQLERWQQQSGNGPITIVCSDGLGRSGAFAALNHVIERVKVEQVVDVFQAIKAMRIQRAHLVKSLEQYRFIYHAVEEYLQAFDDYANFK
eukprot:gene1275-1406_t